MEAGSITCRVPQLSILEPLLFLIYVNAIPQGASNSHTYLYACDTRIFLSTQGLYRNRKYLSKEFLNVCEWFVDKKLLVGKKD